MISNKNKNQNCVLRKLNAKSKNSKSNIVNISIVLIISIALFVNIFAIKTFALENPIAGITGKVDEAGKGFSAIESVVNTVKSVGGSLFGGGPVVHGLLSGAVSAYSTYSTLSEKIKFDV
ncbi:MAG: hypothetical protein V1824_04010, partial [archaeon]